METSPSLPLTPLLNQVVALSGSGFCGVCGWCFPLFAQQFGN